ncbi:bifunctional GNAT family N-acetyltransferase/hotdog fold thioesterase [Rheinheimera sp.]|uniref:bifunctional GNAT family N-acetyltransferase/hotdog fold thioesterase n=1 Tax=Rheinheimera sp. TaxID=1869214 RepID=UPI00307E2CA8
MKWQLRSPQTPAEWQAYYLLRWQVLRAPWHQPQGSERDELEQDAFHSAAWTEQGEVVAVGRVHKINAQQAQVRYMAVSPDWQGHGLGALVLQQLEQQALQWHAQQLVLNARESAAGFYRKLGYQYLEPANALFGIAHDRYGKALAFQANTSTLADWRAELQHTWHQTIPLSAYMQLGIQQLSPWFLETQVPLPPNINLHQTMFAGSIYTTATLTGWGMVWLLLQEHQQQGHIVLADAQIRYLKPVPGTATARCYRYLHQVDWTALAQGRKVRVPVTVELWSDSVLAAEFRGQFAVLPKH